MSTHCPEQTVSEHVTPEDDAEELVEEELVVDADELPDEAPPCPVLDELPPCPVVELDEAPPGPALDVAPVAAAPLGPPSHPISANPSNEQAINRRSYLMADTLLMQT